MKLSYQNINQKTWDLHKFGMYIRDKLRINKLLKCEYVWSEYYNKLKWFSYINKQRHEANLINKLKNTFGEEAVFIIGDWSDSGKLKFISTRIGIKRKLAQHFDILSINEFNTSKLHHKPEVECENF